MALRISQNIRQHKYRTSTVHIKPESRGSRGLETALLLLSDRFAAVRAQGLIQLRELILSRDEETVSQIDNLITIFKSNLLEEDEYARVHEIIRLVPSIWGPLKVCQLWPI